MERKLKRTGRPQKVLPEELRQIILAYVRIGESDRRIRKLTGVSPNLWIRTARRDQAFGALLEKARAQRNGFIGALIRNTVIEQVKKGHPWYTKLAMANYKTGLKNPDVVEAVKVKKLIQKAIAADPDADSYFETQSSVDATALPPGAVPALPQPPAVPDGAGGPAER